MLVAPPPSRYDLNFRLFGFPVRVHPLFWPLMAVFGANTSDAVGPEYLQHLLVWVAAAFVSFLVHELGHAFAYRACGVGASVVLYWLGGLAISWGGVGGRWRRIGVALAGPAAGFVLFGLVWGSNRYVYPWAREGPALRSFFDGLFLINLYWGLMNLLPVVPLDGGRVSEELCEMGSRWNGRRLALQISAAVATLMAAYSLACVVGVKQGAAWLAELPWWAPIGTLWTALLFGVLAYQSYQLLQQDRWTDSHWDRY